MCTENKLIKLKDRIKELESVVVAFLGGVDSSFLLKVAYEVLGNRAIAITAKSSTYPEREFNEALRFTADYGIPLKVITSEELDVEGFSENPLNRCYLCKQELFKKMKQFAIDEGFNYIVEGSNNDDLGDYRPGLQAVTELGIISPLRDVELNKGEIRYLSKRMGLKTWDKPSFACLSSRFPYGEKITTEKLQMVEKAEQLLIEQGFKQVRVRHHGSIARIEAADEDFEKLIDKQVRRNIYSELKEIGFLYIALDLMGYRTGSMNEGFYKSSDKEPI